MRHSERAQNFGRDLIFEWRAAAFLDQVSSESIAGIRVRHSRSGFPSHNLRTAEMDERPLERFFRRRVEVVKLREREIVKARGMLEQLGERYRTIRCPRLHH